MRIKPMLTAALGAALLASSVQADDKVFGWVEKATVEPWGVEVKAKLDSGALTSSLDAREIESFEKDGETWVRFRLKLEDEESGELFSERMELPLYRDLKVRGAGGRDERPVVLMKVCLGDTVYEEQFGLRDRGEMHYPLLLGRRTISHLGLLDVRDTFLTEPRCDDDSRVVEHDPAEDDD
ncbi:MULTISPECIES: ATP-dependent zinc protease [unclassified Halomonas]|uniref:retropepsin-like aspartic peptidase RloA3 n=1 Tax=unclassified Halomonas TaxID=2609666 RepID=UPI001E487E04|nr:MULTISPECIES: ATP-dependent zinc protease [unclassified Halomonas]MDT0501994.1 ATP-dependent zinc protease [Halomonas sp. PAR7]MDT0511794.1 ATP-dependent zinc protease [Halomonas sp. LES1]MDT0592127.1 ATP-dependent zinc protease [Halomonas sp. PAR8]